jgi:hypothetical protein
MGDEEREEREEVAEQIEADPETADEAAEQRTDDYDGLARRLDEIADELARRFDALDAAVSALGVSVVERASDTSEAVDELQDVADGLLGIDALDLL